MRFTGTLVFAGVCAVGAGLWAWVDAAPEGSASRTGLSRGARAATALPTNPAALEEWVKSNPDDFVAWRWLGLARRARGDAGGADRAFARAAELCRYVRPAPPTDPALDELRVVFTLGFSLAMLGKSDEAQEPLEAAARLAYDRTRDRPGEGNLWSLLGWSYQLLGRDEEARAAWGDGLEAMRRALSTPERKPGALYDSACFTALLGDQKAALDLLDDAVSAGWNDGDLASWDPDLQSLWHQPRFHRAITLMRQAQ